MRRFRLLLLGLGAAMWGGCTSVPDIYFVEGVDAADAATDGGSDATEDAPSDAATDGDGPLGCPSVVPSGYDGCCGESPCKGECTKASCDRCGSCSAGEICCAKQVNALCKSPVACN